MESDNITINVLLNTDVLRTQMRLLEIKKRLMILPPLPPTDIARNLWIYLYLHFNIDTRWQRNAWMKICEKTQSDLDRDNSVWLWEKSVLKNL